MTPVRDVLASAIGAVRLLLPALGVALFVVAISGCGSGSPVGLTTVSGSVTLDGAPVQSGNITFMPVGGSGHSASGKIEAGKYLLSTFHPDDGAPAGDYSVAVQSYTVEPTMEDPKGKPAIPERYFMSDSSGLTAKVQDGGSQTIDFPLTK